MSELFAVLFGGRNFLTFLFLCFIDRLHYSLLPRDYAPLQTDAIYCDSLQSDRYDVDMLLPNTFKVNEKNNICSASKFRMLNFAT